MSEIDKTKIDEAKKVLEEAAKAEQAEFKRVEDEIKKILDDCRNDSVAEIPRDVFDGKYGVHMGFVLMLKSKED